VAPIVLIPASGSQASLKISPPNARALMAASGTSARSRPKPTPGISPMPDQSWSSSVNSMRVPAASET
jgi:hypothetical protein